MKGETKKKKRIKASKMKGKEEGNKGKVNIFLPFFFLFQQLKWIFEKKN